MLHTSFSLHHCLLQYQMESIFDPQEQQGEQKRLTFTVANVIRLN